MRFTHQISITSETAVGSSTTFRALKENLEGQPYRWVSGGEMFRNRAAAHRMTVEEFVVHCHDHPEERHDHEIDQEIARMAEQDWMICEGRVPHILMPLAFKVLLVCRIQIRAQRRQKDQPHKSFSNVFEEILARDHHDRMRNEGRCPGCIWLPNQFDLVVDTELSRPGSIAEFILEEHGVWSRDEVATVR